MSKDVRTKKNQSGQNDHLRKIPDRFRYLIRRGIDGPGLTLVVPVVEVHVRVDDQGVSNEFLGREVHLLRPAAISSFRDRQDC